MNIVGITVSMDFKHSTYGGNDAQDHFVSFRAETPEDDPGVTPEDALLTSLDLHLQAYKSLLSAELMGGQIKSEVYNAKMERITARMQRIRAFLKEAPSNGQA